MARTALRDYYEVLGIARQASDKEIKTAYRQLAIQFALGWWRSKPGRVYSFVAGSNMHCSVGLAILVKVGPISDCLDGEAACAKTPKEAVTTAAATQIPVNFIRSREASPVAARFPDAIDPALLRCAFHQHQLHLA